MTDLVDRPTPAHSAAPAAAATRDVVPGIHRIVFGGDYNPEQWPRETWADDVRLMRAAGVNLASIGIFSWALLEPREGEFDFGWLDDVIELLHGAGIGVSLGTPTAAPPAWFWRAHPDAHPVTRAGVRLGYGSRGMVSPSSPAYAAACERIVTALARRYGRHPALRLWHVHNEYGAPVSESYDDHSVVAFRAWLRRRHGSLDALNHAWGTTFWGQHYGEWDEIDAPREAASVVNPAQRLDFARFTNDALLACFVRERDILHRLSPGIPVTTNFQATSCPAIDYWSWTREVDVVSNDHYLSAERDDAHVLLSMDADLTRSLAGGRPWILMEHSTSAVNWQERNIAKRPGELSRNSLAHWARGADGIMFFQWRASRFGSEKFHSAMIPHAGTDTRVFRETRELAGRLGALGETRGASVPTRVAMLWDWESFWAQDLEWRPTNDLDHRRQLERYYTWLWRAGVTVDFAHPEADLSGYDLVVAPSLYLMTARAAENLRAFVRAGGVLVAGYFSGIVDENDTIPLGPIPAGLADVLGVQVEEFRPLRAGETVTLTGTPAVDAAPGAAAHNRRGMPAGRLTGSVWTDALHTAGAEAVASYADGPSAGGAALTRNRYGAGAAWYVSTELGLDDLATALAPVLADAGIAVDPHKDPEVETVTRVVDDRSYTAYLNHSRHPAPVAGGLDLLTGERSADGFTVPPGGVRVVRRNGRVRPARR